MANGLLFRWPGTDAAAQPVAVTLCLVAITALVPPLPPTTSGRLDTRGIAWLTLSLVALMAGLSSVRLLGVTSPATWLAVAAAFALLVPFVRHELRVAEPLVDVRILVSPPSGRCS